jgi:anti-anti-sigma factor
MALPQSQQPHPPDSELGSWRGATRPPALDTSRPCNGVLVLCLHAAVDQPCCQVLQSRIEDELRREPTCRVIVDLHDVTLLSAAAIGMLLHLRRLTWRRDMRLVLAGASHHAVHLPLHTAGVLPLFDTRPTVQHALPTSLMSTPGAASRRDVQR